jgi:RNA polymerase sigma factor (sigma-70 family)
MDTYLGDKDKISLFETIVLPHLDAAYNLARWLTRKDQDADDLTQAAMVRAIRFFGDFRGGDARAWLLTIVRHTYYTSLRDGRHENDNVCFDELIHTEYAGNGERSSYGLGNNPEAILESHDTRRAVNQALERLPAGFREIVILKEMEGLSYKEIAEISGVPIGTVMSRLARSRKLLLGYLESYAVVGKNGL